jgi:hypothetical protein
MAYVDYVLMLHKKDEASFGYGEPVDHVLTAF